MTDPDDLIRDTVIFKLAKDAESQFWDRLKRPFTQWLAVLTTLLTILGISLGSVLPSWVRGIADKQLKDSLESVLKVHEDRAKAWTEVIAVETNKASNAATNFATQMKSVQTESKKISKEFREHESEINKLIKKSRDEINQIAKFVVDMKKQKSSLDDLQEIDISSIERWAKKIEKTLTENDTIEELSQLPSKVNELESRLAELQRTTNTDSVVQSNTTSKFFAKSFEVKEMIENGAMSESQHNSDGSTFEEYVCRIRWPTEINEPVVFVKNAKLLHNSGIPNFMVPDIGVLVDDVRRDGCTLTIRVVNSATIAEANVSFVVFEENFAPEISQVGR